MKTHRSLTPRQEALAERNLYAAIGSLRGAPRKVRAFLRDLCTPAELQAMADRWSVVDHLGRGVPYREIHRLTGVSVTTIGPAWRAPSLRGQRWLCARRLQVGQVPCAGGGSPAMG